MISRTLTTAVRAFIVALFLVASCISSSHATSTCSWGKTYCAVNPTDSYGAYCDMYNCHCGPPFYTSSTTTISRCRQPAWICPNCCAGLLYDQKSVWDQLTITSFSVDQSIYNPATRDILTIQGSIEELAGATVKWQLTIAGPGGTVKTVDGGGTGISETWNGKVNGEPAPAGPYNAHLVAWVVDDNGSNRCSQNTDASFKLEIPHAAECELKQKTNSSVDILSGNLSFSLDLFSAKGGVLPLTTSLYYNSLDPGSGVLGAGWSHNHDITLQSFSNAIRVREGDYQTYHYNLSATKYYVGERPGDGSITIDSNGNFVRSLIDGRIQTFSSAGKLINSRDQFGNILAYSYNTDGDLFTVGDGTRGITFTYDTAVTPHRLSTISDPNLNAYTFQYSSDGHLYHVVFPVTDTGVAPAYWEYAYTTDGKLSSKLDPLGNLVRYEYNSDGKLAASYDPEWTPGSQGHSHQIIYPALNSGDVRTSTFTEKDGGVWTKTYDVTISKIKEKIAPDGIRTSYTHYPDGTLKSKTEPGADNINYTTFYTYDANGNVSSETDPTDCTALGIDPATVSTTDPRLKVAHRYSYDLTNQNRMLSSSDLRGAVPLTTGYQYSTDANGILTTLVTDPTGATTVTVQYPNGNILETIDPNGRKTSYTYRGDGLPEMIIDPTGMTTWYSGYDANGNNTEIKVKDTTGTVLSTTRMAYDARNRLRSSTTIVPGLPDSVTNYSYDAGDNQTVVTDPETNNTYYEYNYNHQVTRTTDALNNSTIYNYGATGCPSCGGGSDKLTRIIDAKQQETSYSYDQMGRLLTETDPLGKKLRYTYHPNGKLKERYDASDPANEKLLVSYSYDKYGQLKKKQYADGTSESYDYDANGRIRSTSNANIGYSYQYHDNGRLKSVTDKNNRQVNYDRYNGLGQKTRVIVSDGADSRTTNYDFDNVNRLKTITATAGAYNFGYDSQSRRSSVTYPNAITTTYGYDGQSRLTTIRHASGATTIAFANYSGFDKVGNRKNKITGSGTSNYSYDPIYRLTQATTPKDTENYSYDAVGNRQTGPGAKDGQYQYNAGNQMTRGRQYGYSYDNAGNQTARTLANNPDKGWIQTWDLENRLVKMERTKGADKLIINFTYDPQGRRIGKQLTTITDGITKTSSWTYVYDNDNIVLELYTDPTGATEKTWYTHGAGVDEHLAMERSGAYYYFHADGLGSITAITDAGKNIMQTYEYDSFGVPKASTGFRNSYTYTGREWDKETGLYYYRARYYDPMEGRFIQKDPIGFEGGINVYNYVGSNPINFTDPTGLLTSAEALAHYLGGSGTALTMQFNEISTSSVRVTSFPQVHSELKRGCGSRTVKIDSRSGFSTSGDAAATVGSITLRLQGTLTICGCSWSFDGALKSFDDIYDFNRATHRSRLGELSTAVGNYLPGRSYTIHILGEKPISASGTL